MDKKTALEIIVAHACCKSNLNMCGKCPWRHTDDCRDTILEEENVKMKLSEIKISNAFASTTPREDKVNVCRNYCEESLRKGNKINYAKNVNTENSLREYYCDGICECCDKGKHYKDEGKGYYTCDPKKVKGLRVIAPMPNY